MCGADAAEDRGALAGVERQPGPARRAAVSAALTTSGGRRRGRGRGGRGASVRGGATGRRRRGRHQRRLHHQLRFHQRDVQRLPGAPSGGEQPARPRGPRRASANSSATVLLAVRERSVVRPVLKVPLVVVPAEQQAAGRGRRAGDRTDDRLGRLTDLVLQPAPRRRLGGAVQPLMDHPLHADRRPRQPLRDHLGPVVDGHSAHAADSRRAANTDSSAALRRRYGQAVVSVPDSRNRSNATKWSGHSPEARAAPAPRCCSRFCSRFCSRSKASRPAASHTTSSPSIAVASGSCPAPATASGNAGAISVPRLERSTTRPASTETRALNPSHFGSPRPARPQIGPGRGSVQHRLRKRPRHTRSLPPSAPLLSFCC
jgi:hypothetical protein